MAICKATESMVQATIQGLRLATLVLIGYWGVIFIATHIPKGQMPDISKSDKLMHMIAFAGLAFLLAWAFPKESKRPYAHLIGAWIVACAYGAVDELSQIPVGRHADVRDWIADSIGAVLGLIAYMIARKLWIRIRKRFRGRDIQDANLTRFQTAQSNGPSNPK